MLSNRKVILKSPRLQRKKRVRIFLKIFLVIFLISAFFVGLYFFLRLSFLTISQVVISGTEVINPADISSETNSILSGSAYFFIPMRNILFYPRTTLENSLKKSFPRIESLSISLEKNVLNIVVTEKKAFALWCDTSCYFLDSSGDIFSPAPDFSGNVYKIFSGSVDGDPLGKIFLGEEAISGIKKIYDASEALGIPIGHIEASSTNDVRLSGDDGASLLIDLRENPDDIISNLEAVINSDEFKKAGISPKNLEYIDLRFGTKVFFKEKGIGNTASSTSGVK